MWLGFLFYYLNVDIFSFIILYLSIGYCPNWFIWLNFFIKLSTNQGWLTFYLNMKGWWFYFDNQFPFGDFKWNWNVNLDFCKSLCPNISVSFSSITYGWLFIILLLLAFLLFQLFNNFLRDLLFFLLNFFDWRRCLHFFLSKLFFISFLLFGFSFLFSLFFLLLLLLLLSLLFFGILLELFKVFFAALCNYSLCFLLIHKEVCSSS